MANLRTRSDRNTEALVRMGTSTTTAYYTDTILNNWQTQAHRWAAGYKKWPFSEGRVSTTFASLITDEDGLLRGEYPEGWKPDSIRLLTIGNKKVEKKNFYKFKEFLEENESSDERIFSDFGLNYYVNPRIDLSGTVMVWGQFTPTADITNENELTIFTDKADEANEAIVYEMMSYAMIREKKFQEQTLYHQKALEVLDILWKKIQDEQFAYQDASSDGMFERLDVLGGATRDDLFKRDQFY